MAQLRIYKCEKCGYTVRTEPQGFYGLMSGMYYNFKCSNCKRIIELGLSGKGILPNCPYCHETCFLSTWNPIEGRCPQCGGKMIQPHPHLIISAD